MHFVLTPRHRRCMLHRISPAADTSTTEDDRGATRQMEAPMLDAPANQNRSPAPSGSAPLTKGWAYALVTDQQRAALAQKSKRGIDRLRSAWAVLMMERGFVCHYPNRPPLRVA